MRRGRRLAAGGRAELAQDVRHVHAGRLGRDEQLVGDVPVAAPGRDRPGAGALPLQSAAGAARGRSGGHPDPRKRQDRRRCQDGSSPRHPDGGSGLRHAQPDDGRFAERRGARDRLQNHSPAHRRVRRHYALQFSRHGAAVDVPVRDRLRQHLCAEAVGKGSAHADAHHRTCWRRPACLRAF